MIQLSSPPPHAVKLSKDSISIVTDESISHPQFDRKNKKLHRQQQEVLHKLTKVIVLAGIFMALEVIGGIISQSIAILSDAAHMLSDLLGFVISMIAVYISTFPPNDHNSFGYHRAGVLGALASIVLIWVLTGFLVYQAIVRMIHLDEMEINANVMLVTAIFGLITNLIMMKFLHESHHHHGGEAEHNHDHKENKSNSEHKNEYKSCCRQSPRKENEELIENNKIKDQTTDAHSGEDPDETPSDIPVEVLSAPESATQVNKMTLLSNNDKEAHFDEENHDHHHHHDHGHNHDHHHGHSHSPGHKHNHKHSPGHEHSRKNDHHHDHHHHDHDDHHGHSHGHGHGCHGHSHDDLNLRAAAIHILGDILQSIGVIIGSVVIQFSPEKFKIIDPLLTLVFSIIVLSTTKRVLMDCVNILMQSAPQRYRASDVTELIEKIPNVIKVSNLHIWSLTLDKYVLSAHVLVSRDSKGTLKKITELCRKLKIKNSTIQIETAEE